MLCRSHCWDNYQWKWDPRLILFFILRIMLSIIWERLKGLFRLFPSYSHNYTTVAWAEQVETRRQLHFGSCVNGLLRATRQLGIALFSHMYQQTSVSRLHSMGLVQNQMHSKIVQLSRQLTCVSYLKSKPGMLHHAVPCSNRSSVLKFARKLGSRKLSRFTYSMILWLWKQIQLNLAIHYT